MLRKEKRRNLLFIDTETTGLDAKQNEILEIGCVLTDPTAETILQTYEAKLMPRRIETASPKALEINGYSKEAWSAEVCTEPSAVTGVLCKLAENAVTVGHNVGFDLAFLTEFLACNAVTKPPWHYHKVDTVSLAWPLLQWGEIQYVTLDAVCERFEVERPKVHRALADALACRSIYLALLKYYK